MLGTSWKTSLMGWIVIIGDIVAFISKIVQDQGLPQTLVEWIAFGMALITGIALILAKDRDVTGLPKAVPVVLLAIMAMGLTACASDGSMGGGRYLHAVTSEVRSPLGTDVVAVVPQNCVREKDPNSGWLFTDYLYTECYTEKGAVVASSPGAAKQIIAATIQAAGIAAAGALIGNGAGSTANATAGAMQSQTVVPRGHH